MFILPFAVVILLIISISRIEETRFLSNEAFESISGCLYQDSAIVRLDAGLLYNADNHRRFQTDTSRRFLAAISPF